MDKKIKSVILAGGYATRLWPLTKNRSKVLLPIDGNTTVIDSLIAELHEDERVSDIYISTNERFETDIKTHIQEKNYEGVHVSVESTQAENEKLGVVGALSQLVEREGLSDNDLFIVGGDNYMSVHLSRIIDSYERKPALVAYDVENKEKASSYGVVDTVDGYITEFEEKPENPSSTLVSTACYLIPSDQILFNEYLSDDNNPDEPGWYMEWLSNRSEMQAIPFEGEWLDIGTMKDYLASIRVEMNGANYLSDNAEVANVDLKGNNIVMGNSTLKDCSVKNTVVFDGVELVNCSVDSSILDSNCYINGADLNNSMVSTDKEE